MCCPASCSSLVVLLQQGKGGDMASAFGGGGSQTAFGARAGATVLTKATTILGVLFMLGAIALGIIGQRGPGSLMSGVEAPRGSRSAGPAGARSRRRRASVGAEQSDVAGDASYVESPSSRKWRNWQTHQLEGLAFARTWGFESPLSHQL